MLEYHQRIVEHKHIGDGERVQRWTEGGPVDRWYLEGGARVEWRVYIFGPGYGLLHPTGPGAAAPAAPPIATPLVCVFLQSLDMLSESILMFCTF